MFHLNLLRLKYTVLQITDSGKKQSSSDKILQLTQG